LKNKIEFITIEEEIDKTIKEETHENFFSPLIHQLNSSHLIDELMTKVLTLLETIEGQYVLYLNEGFLNIPKSGHMKHGKAIIALLYSDQLVAKKYDCELSEIFNTMIDYKGDDESFSVIGSRGIELKNENQEKVVFDMILDTRIKAINQVRSELKKKTLN
jgi:hypothetical protein